MRVAQRRRRGLAGRALAAVLLAAGAGLATPAGGQEVDRLTIGTRDTPPFAIEGEGGRWTGISIELWREIASQLDLQYEIREYGPVPELLAAVERGEVDAGVAALTVTGDREQVMDFSHPFYTTGFGIAVAPFRRDARAFDSVTRFFRGRFLKVLGSLALLLAVMGTLAWLTERKHNPEQFPPKPLPGIWNGFWWAAVTMVTVGYGDKAPKTVLGRLVGLFWLFASVILLAGFIAAMTSSLTVSQLEAPIRGPEDLVKARVATLAGSTSEAYLREQRIPFQYYPDLAQAVQAVADRKVDAAVYDAPLLQYLVNQGFVGQVEMLDQTFGQQDYAIALPTGSALREPINRALLSERIRAAWQDILFRYLQEAPAPPAKP